MPINALKKISPFKFLKREQLDRWAQYFSRRSFAPGEVICEQGVKDSDLYLIVQGRVLIFDNGPPRRFIGVIEQNNYFGERSILFDEPREVQVEAEREVECLYLPGKDFLQLLKETPVISQTLIRNLQDKQGLFVAFDHFLATLWDSIARGSLPFDVLLDRYRALKPALHPLIDSEEIDVDGLAYAVPRLPANLTETFVFLLTRTPSRDFAEAHMHSRAADSAARRRNAWQLAPGKDLVLLRDGTTDAIDFITNLCLYAHELRRYAVGSGLPSFLVF